ncbi:type VI secretion system protein TssA [Polyangium jinanense]|uniref:Type VI secretion system protein TssA n=1 Tax=Polyangium jinanense TaxID=2829994 RepID=A0A9X3X943_9BACT|nr:type VI secretion system protein TssA [Polyangium jinanense]MDC3956747.1 type VI secretion system protein TssA [Polyangium jinanense]MDC3984810.1 type VI secretion system protein TssA [Polyangium jinanense]
MSTKAPLIDLEILLQPISEEAPCGTSLRYEGTYDRVREARREDDPSLPMGEWETKLKVSDLALVDKLCQEALRKKSKDLQIAAWLVEAWLRRYRVKGLGHGLSLVTGLCERFWDGLFPEVGDDPDAAARAALYEWMDDVLSDRLRRTPFTEGDGSFSLLDWELGGASVSADGEGEGARPTRESLLAKISLGGAGTRWTDIALDAGTAIMAAEAAEAAIAAQISRPPTLRRVREVLTQIELLARETARINGESVPVASAPAASPPPLGSAAAAAAAFTAPSGGGAGGSFAITSRADAYYRLAEAAEYLMRTEPHSPVPYLVKRAVQWGNMSLAQLLYEFVGNPDDLVAIQRLLGMRGREE